MPFAADPGPQPDDLHRRLAERGVALLPEPVDSDLRLTLGDAMLATVVMACGFALARTSVLLGVGFFAIAMPSLVRTALAMSRLRALGVAPNPWRWAVAFLSSMVRVATTLAIGAVAYGLGLAVGLGFLALVPALGAGRSLVEILGWLTAILLGAALSTPVLVFVGLGLLPIRDRGMRRSIRSMATSTPHNPRPRAGPRGWP